ncbi:MAG: hypothetical protein MUF42_17155 [Cytophagaceae bacterium]|jgi:hypothetical protein|nr:hypothetical protein [Cytophagaceae bacterium]
MDPLKYFNKISDNLDLVYSAVKLAAMETFIALLLTDWHFEASLGPQERMLVASKICCVISACLLGLLLAVAGLVLLTQKVLETTLNAVSKGKYAWIKKLTGENKKSELFKVFIWFMAGTSLAIALCTSIIASGRV